MPGQAPELAADAPGTVGPVEGSFERPPLAGRWKMELRQIQYVVALAETLNFGRAADMLGIGQPAVSQQIARLERELGVVLFERSSRSVRLSDAGERLAPQARAVLAALAQADSAARGVGVERNVQTRLGSSAGLGARLDRLLVALKSSSPTVTVELVRSPRATRLDMVRSGQLGCTFVRGMESAPGLDLVQVWEDALLVVVPAHHPAADHDAVSLADLAQLPLRLSPRAANPQLVDLVMAACAGAGVEPRVIFRTVGLEETLATIGSGLGWTVIYESLAQLLRSESVAFRPVAPPGLRMPTALAIPAGSDSQLLTALVRACLVVADQ